MPLDHPEICAWWANKGLRFETGSAVAIIVHAAPQSGKSNLMASLLFALAGPEEERAKQHAGPLPPAPPGTALWSREQRLPLTERSHARAGVLSDTETGEAHQKKTLSPQEKRLLLRTSSSRWEQSSSDLCFTECCC